MAFGFGSLFGDGKKQLERQEFAATREQTGFSITYEEFPDGRVSVRADSSDGPTIDMSFPNTGKDEAHILYMQSTELLAVRAAAGKERDTIRRDMDTLFNAYRR